MSWLSGRALYVTWSNALADRAKEWFRAHAPAELDIDVMTFAELLARIDPSRPVVADLPLPRAVDLLASRLDLNAAQLGPWWGDRRLRGPELYAELHAHLFGAAMPVAFRGRRACTEPRLSDTDYQGLRAPVIRDATKGALIAAKKLGADDLAKLFPGPIGAFERARALQVGELVLDESLAYDHVLVDEVQDLTLAEQWLLLDVTARAGRARNVKPGMVVAGDEAQTVRPTAFEFGSLSELVIHRLDVHTEKTQHELDANLRSPQTVAGVINRARKSLYGRLDRSYRPRGRVDDSPADVTVGKVMQIVASTDDQLRATLRLFADAHGDAALVYPGALLPEAIRRAAEDVGALVWTSEMITRTRALS